MTLPSFLPAAFKTQTPYARLYEEVYAHLYKKIGLQDEELGQVDVAADFAVLLYNPQNLVHFIQMLEFAVNSGDIILFMNKEGIQITSEHADWIANSGGQKVSRESVNPEKLAAIIPEWMEQSYKYYKANNLYKLAVGSNLSIIKYIPAKDRKANPEWITRPIEEGIATRYAELASMVDNTRQEYSLEELQEYFGSLENLFGNIPSGGEFTKGLLHVSKAKRSTHVWHGSITFRHVSVNSELMSSTHDLNSTNSRPYLLIIQNISIRKWHNEADPSPSSTFYYAYGPMHNKQWTNLPSFQRAREIVLTHGYDIFAACYSMPLLWNYFQTLAISTSLAFKGSETIQQMSIPKDNTHCFGILLKNMNTNDEMRFLLLEFYPLIFCSVKPNGQPFGFLSEHAGSLSSRNRDKWAAHFQTISFLYSNDIFLPQRLATLPDFFSEINTKEDVLVPLIDESIVLGKTNMKYYQKGSLFGHLSGKDPLEDTIFPSFGLDLVINEYYYCLLDNMHSLLHCIDNAQEIARIEFIPSFSTELPDENLYWMSCIKEYLRAILRSMSSIQFYKKNDAKLLKILTIGPKNLGPILNSPILEVSLQEVLPQRLKHFYKCLNYFTNVGQFDLQEMVFKTAAEQILTTLPKTCDGMGFRISSLVFRRELKTLTILLVLIDNQTQNTLAQITISISPRKNNRKFKENRASFMDSGPQVVYLHNLKTLSTISEKHVSNLMSMAITIVLPLGESTIPIACIRTLSSNSVWQEWHPYDVSMIHARYIQFFSDANELALAFLPKSPTREKLRRHLQKLYEICKDDPNLIKKPWFDQMRLGNELQSLLSTKEESKKTREEWKSRLTSIDIAQYFHHWLPMLGTAAQPGEKLLFPGISTLHLYNTAHKFEWHCTETRNQTQPSSSHQDDMNIDYDPTGQ